VARSTVALIGNGRAGGAIRIALQRAGYDVAVLPRGAPHATADVTIVAVPDHAIEGVAADLAPGAAGRLVVHTSGATSVEALREVRSSGGRVGSLHPLQTLPDAERGAEALRGAPVAVTCEDADRATLHALAAAWGGVPFDLPDEAKPLYHAAAILASNDVVALLAAARELLEHAGVPPEVHDRLVAATVENVAAVGPKAALTGPVARGDLDVVRSHVEAIKALGADGEPILDAYRALTVLTGRLAGVDVAEALG
jgi:predicted short-subunit dehydrogenase-like oxidoreductase (DUF2520 family)